MSWPRGLVIALAAVAIATGAIVVGVAASGGTYSLAIKSGDPTARPHVLVLYIGADDCAPCRTWHSQHEPAFQASSAFQRIEYRQVRSPTLFSLLKDEYWPEALRGYRAQIEPGTGVPLWFVVADDRVVLKSAGISQWDAKVLPAIRALVR